MKKLVALMLTLILCLSLFALPTLAEKDKVFRYDEPVTLKVSIFDRGVTGGSPVDNNFWTKWIQENFGTPRNINIEWVVIPRTEEVDKLNILMASGEAADICFTYNESVVTNFVKQGGLVELSKLLDEYGPTIKSFLGEDLLKYGVFEGGQYVIPAKRIVLATQGMFIREDWLEKLGMTMPKTKDEFYQALVAFRDKNPGASEGGCIPFAVMNDLSSVTPLMYSFIKDLSEKNLATVPDVMWEGYEDFVVFMNKLYNEKLLSPDFALDNANLFWGDVTSGKAGGYVYNYDHPIRVSPGILASLRAYSPEAKLSPLNCFESVTDPTKYYHGMYAENGISCFVPIFSKHPEAAVMYMDWLCQYETIYFLQNGVEGTTYSLNEEGIPIVMDAQGEYKFNSMQNLDYTLLVNGQFLNEPEKLLKAQATSYQGFADLFEEEFIVGNTDPIRTSFHFDTVLQSEAQYGTSLTAFKKELLTKAVMATPDKCVETFRALRDQYMSMGGTEVMNEKIAAWDKMQK